MTATVTLINGRTVPSDSPEWRDETLARWRHVQAVMALRGKSNQPARQQYIEQIDAREGAEAGRRLREQIQKAWGQGEKA